MADFFGEIDGAELVASRFERDFFGVVFRSECQEGLEEEDLIGFLTMRILAKAQNGFECPEYSRAVMYMTHAAGELERRTQRRSQQGLTVDDLEPAQEKGRRFYSKKMAARTIEQTTARMQQTADERSKQLVLRPFKKQKE